ncbi:MAG: sulfatase-like hydrolase/transferase [Caldilineaceae bacterium SB0661_bin_32]|uniref:Sulfatase-like hydrolase/transferase n=1 Tax=Caldilineaceae bacterium SB0661_bin_32 TaxID=2605255 RepID=A0A6B1D4J6_9CHLR|nr:sulfatase-like hydrolase/transferase [Caldilineaceae bacterium SB0661_bin_32]
MKRPNILLIMSDEHAPAVTGCYGHPLAQTPNLDRLAAEGTLFENAYCNNPICVPSRISFLTGKYASDVNVFDNGSPLASEIPTFAHYLQASGYETTLCGRMHMIGPDRLHGFGQRLFDDMNDWVRLGKGPVRTPDARRNSNSHVTECGPGPPRWLDYDRTVTDLSERFLRDKAGNPSDRPWCLVSSFMYPHFPLYAPQEYLDLYPANRIALPDLGDESFESQHPAIRQLRYFFHNDQPLPEELTRAALASYFALVTLTDEHIGRLITIVDDSPLLENTVIIYLSDHGEMAGQHGIWQKQCFYESSVRVPLIVKGPRLEAGARVNANVSLVDIMPTLLDLAGTPIPGGLRGRSLLPALRGAALPDDLVVAEYHAQGMLSAGYMAKKGNLKYNYYVDLPPQLFDLAADPNEFVNLAGHSGWAGPQSDLHSELLAKLDPEEVDGRAKRNQLLEGMARSYAG